MTNSISDANGISVAISGIPEGISPLEIRNRLVIRSSYDLAECRGGEFRPSVPQTSLNQQIGGKQE